MIAPAPTFEQTRCTRYRYRYSGCRRCADACLHEAISLDDAGATIDAGKCRNCALCTTACRTAALVSVNLPRVDLLKQAIKGKRSRFACVPSGADGDAKVPCLGAIDAVILAYLAKRGIEVELHGAAHCQECDHGSKGAAWIVANIEERDALEQACADENWAVLTVVEDGQVPAAEDFRAGRRQLFRRLLGRGVDEAAKAIALAPMVAPVQDKAIRPGPWHVPEMRELLQLVSRRADAAPCRTPASQSLAAAELNLAPGCIQCEACIRACPTGALQIREGEADWTFLFLSDRCSGCDLCVEVCQPHVLSLSEIVELTPGGAGKVLDARAKQRCLRCDRFFVSPEPQETCPVCRDDDDAFAEIFG